MSDASPVVTLCVPTIGRVELLAATRASIETQRFDRYEVLVLDNASSADSERLLEAWAKSDARVRILRVEPRIPMFQNFNRGFAAARGEYVAFCHDDDTLGPDFLEKQVRFMNAHPRAGVSGSNYDFIDESGQLTERRRPIARTEVWSGRRYIRTLMLRGRNPLTMQGVFYRRSAVGPEGIDLALPIHYGDFVFLMRIAQGWDVGLLAESLIQVRRHRGQASAQFRASENFVMRTAVLERYAAELRAEWPGDRLFHAILATGVGVSHRVGLLWGWMAAQDAEEAHACSDQLGSTLIDSALSTVLGRIDRIVPTSNPARRRLAQALARPSMSNRAQRVVPSPAT